MQWVEAKIGEVELRLRTYAPVQIAVSGGVDSMTLALLAGRTLGRAVTMCHARSPAVPAAATERINEIARTEGWRLQLVDAAELRDEDYLANPYRRCFHCKKNLYATLARTGGGTILSGTNSDDLNDFRPGLEAAEHFGVRHPFVECGLDKAAIRRVCHHLGYRELARLPASPCLASRIETGLRIDPARLGFIERVEEALRRTLRPLVVRCRLRPGEIAIQLDADTLDRLTHREAEAWCHHILTLAAPLELPGTVHFEPYRMGSAFVPNH